MASAVEIARTQPELGRSVLRASYTVNVAPAIKRLKLLIRARRLHFSLNGVGCILGLFTGTFNVFPGSMNGVASDVHAQ